MEIWEAEIGERGGAKKAEAVEKQNVESPGTRASDKGFKPQITADERRSKKHADWGLVPVKSDRPTRKFPARFSDLSTSLRAAIEAVGRHGGAFRHGISARRTWRLPVFDNRRAT